MSFNGSLLEGFEKLQVCVRHEFSSGQLFLHAGILELSGTAGAKIGVSQHCHPHWTHRQCSRLHSLDVRVL